MSISSLREGILGDVGVRRRHISLGLVVVVVGDKILHCVVWEEFFEFAVELCRQSLVMGDDQRGLIQLLDGRSPS